MRFENLTYDCVPFLFETLDLPPLKERFEFAPGMNFSDVELDGKGQHRDETHTSAKQIKLCDVSNLRGDLCPAVGRV